MTNLDSAENTFLTVAEVAARYRISRTSLDRWRAQGAVPAPSRFNGRPRWRLSELQAWEAKQGGGE